MESLLRYFPNLTPRQQEQYRDLLPLYSEWNARINVISRRDMEHFYLHHVLHSLAIARVVDFPDHCQVLDVGTGGGFPGIPLAIMFPKVSFTLVDSIGKKTLVASDVARRLGLDNCRVENARVEQLGGKYRYAVSRAVAPMPKLAQLLRGMLQAPPRDGADIPGGLIALKGGELDEELRPFAGRVHTYLISDFFQEDYFLTKKVVVLS